MGKAELRQRARVEKNRRIRESLQTTRERRQAQRPITVLCKLQNLSKRKISMLRRAFLEAKWLWNWLVEDPGRLKLELNKVEEVWVRAGERTECRSLEILGSQTKQAIGAKAAEAFRSVAALRQNGHRAGRVGFKRFFSCIPFKQPGKDFEIRGNRVRLQNLGWFRVLGTHQIPENAEIAKAELLWKPSGFYIAVTAYIPKDTSPPRRDRKGRIRLPRAERFGKPTAVDLGVHDQVALPNGLKVRWEVPESPRLKRLQRRLARKKKGSRNRQRTLQLLRREHERVTNRRRECINRMFGFLRLYEAVTFHDDHIAAWQRVFGGRIQHSSPGALRRRMRAILPTLEVGCREPTTKTCAECGSVQEMALGERIFRCRECGWETDRDTNAALNILRIGLGLRNGHTDGAVPPDWRELTPPELEAAGRILGASPWIRLSFPQ